MVCGMYKKEGLAMGASLSVILANLWPKEYEPALMKKIQKLSVLNEDSNEFCPGCQKKVTYRLKG